MKIKKGDTVIVMKGRDAGKQGKVIKAIPSENKIIVEGANLVSRHEKPARGEKQGQIVKVASPLPVSNVRIIDTTSGKPTRVGKKLVDGRYVRFAKVSGNELN